MTTPELHQPDDASPSEPVAVTVIRSEERAHMTTTSVPRSRLRIQKVIVTEERTITVQVRHEELRITELPVTAEDTPTDAILPVTHHEGDFDLVLRAEEIDIRTTVVPVERVRFTRTRPTHPTDVTVNVDSEQIIVDQ